MTKNRTVISEDAAGGAVAAGGIAVSAMPLMGMVTRQTSTSTAPKAKKKSKRNRRLKHLFDSLVETSDPTDSSMSNTDETGAIAKLKNLTSREKVRGMNTVTFGLEDDDQGVVRVVINADDAERFEQALQQLLSPAENEDQEVSYEIPEILFKLKDQFEIVDVQWPEYHEDEEETQVASPNDPSAMNGAGNGEAGNDPNASADADQLMGDEQPTDPNANMGGAPEADSGSLLTQVIAMMQADAEARKADAEARKAEAQQREASSTVEQAMTKVRQQEQLMDMDAYQKSQREEQKETKQLAQLARWRRMVQDGDEDKDLSTYVSSEDEEAVKRHSLKSRIDPKQLARFIATRVR